MNIGIIPNPKRAEALEICTKVVHKALELNMTPYVPKKYADIACGAVLCEIDVLYSKADVIVAIGGDGTIIRCTQLASSLDKPILGINAGRIGYLASLEPDNLDDLVKIKEGNYNIEQRMMLKVEYNGIVNYALNDFVISRGSQSKLIDLNVDINGHGISYRADGIIISTPTGSTAYSLSAGGPVLEPETNNMVISPICPHSLFSRSLVLDGNSVINVACANDECEAYMSVDGRQPLLIKPDNIITISRAEHCAKIININNLSFYDVLSKKLR